MSSVLTNRCVHLCLSPRAVSRLLAVPRSSAVSSSPPPTPSSAVRRPLRCRPGNGLLKGVARRLGEPKQSNDKGDRKCPGCPGCGNMPACMRSAKLRSAAKTSAPSLGEPTIGNVATPPLGCRTTSTSTAPALASSAARSSRRSSECPLTRALPLTSGGSAGLALPPAIVVTRKPLPTRMSIMTSTTPPKR